MAEILQGDAFVSYFRRRKDHATKAADRLRFETESSISKEKESESTKTKEGMIVTISDGENTAEFTSLAYKDDTGTIEMWRELEEMFDNNELIEFWNVPLGMLEDGDTEVEPTYHQGYFTSFELSMPADGPAELNYSYAINGRGVRGTDTLTEEQLGDLKSTYQYESLQASGTPEA